MLAGAFIFVTLSAAASGQPIRLHGATTQASPSVTPSSSANKLVATVTPFSNDAAFCGYRAAMPINGRNTIVRMPDGIHLNETGSELAANTITTRLKQDFASLK